MVDSTVFSCTDQAGSKAVADIQDLVKKKLIEWECQHPNGEALMEVELTDAEWQPFAVSSSQNTSTVKGKQNIIEIRDR